ncbi:HEAT repeat-containing protein [Muriicola jejuensis]|uniref:HEAT repeat domain-containing protein n=1 Tax=Muriicola jejuensis TaxID=504488 RepID=A0A6P0UFN3_9FLAO|nr:HEAT repeat domain-containing protein [Muriicola jejuensis]NER11260.1 hypothetical protein [Muriicola jejuensis]SMP21830.1 HEAT repeat-containing protein [Muriicola jejuensis]
MLLSIPEIHTDLLWDLSVLFGSLCILYFSFIFFFRNRLSAKSRNIREQRKELTPIISNFLFHGEDATREEKYEHIGLKVEIREFLKDPINRSILKDILLDLQRDLTGDSRTRLLAMYKDFDLHLDAFDKLKSWRWEIVTKGIVELTQMQVEEAYTAIRKFINHRKSVIRKQAQIAAVSLKHEGIAHFLDTNKYPISEWQQIKILEVLREKEDFIPPSFGVWLLSANKDVVLFALRLIRFYNQTDANSGVIQLLKHKDEEIKQAAIDCIKEFGIIEAMPTLMAAFPRAKRDTRILILDAMGAIGKEEHIPFLREVCRKVSNFNVRSKALGAINTIAPGTVLPHENLDPMIDSDVTPKLIDETENLKAELETVPGAPSEIHETAEEEIEVTEEGIELFSEDLEIFDHCFMEELNEILDSRRKDEEDAGYLPLDFLPIVIEKPTEMDKKKPKKKSRKRLWNLKVAYEVVHPDYEFRKELEDILSRVEVQNPGGETEVEYLNFNFLPFVVEDAPQEDLPRENPAGTDQKEKLTKVTDMEGQQTDAVESAILEEKPGEVSEGDDACSLVDWEELSNSVEKRLTEANIEPPIYQEEENTLVDQPRGHSIFADLFCKSDLDAKLILLREIPALGDHRELTFLESLREDPNARLRKMAIEVRKKLSARLKKEEGEGQNRDSIVKWASSSYQSDLLNFDLKELKK